MERLKQHYEFLRIKPGATRDEIKQAYVLAEQKLHADRLADDPLVRHKAQERLRKINVAYMEIMDAYQEVRASLKEGKIQTTPKPSADVPRGVSVKETEDADAADTFEKPKDVVIPTHPENMARSVLAAGKRNGEETSGAAPLSEDGDRPDDGAERMEMGAFDNNLPDKDEAAISDPTDLLRKESYLLFAVVALVIFIMAITWIKTARKSSAPAVATKGTAPVETASPSRKASENIGAVPESTVKKSSTSSQPARQSAAEDTVDAHLVMHDAEQGNAKAQALLGYMFMAGKGVRQDAAEAAKWFRTAAAQGNPEAEDWLGYLYETGMGVPQNYPEAVRLYRLAADQGDADAQKNLGRMYAKGKGVAKNQHEAIKWLRKAATQGNEEAQKALEIWQEE